MLNRASKRPSLAAAIGLLGLVSVGCGAGRGADGPLLVSAAVSLTDVLEVIAVEFERAEGVSVALNLAGSDTLATQLAAGAPADVFVSADVTQMRRVTHDGVVDPARVVPLLANQLAVVTTVEASGAVQSVPDLLRPAIRRVALGDPEAVPAGVYAREYLRSVDLWEALRPKLVPTRDVRAVLAAVAAGHAEAGFVYRTDTGLVDGVRTALLVPVETGPAIRYVAAPVVTSRRPLAATRFLEFLREGPARDVFERAGFVMAAGT